MKKVVETSVKPSMLPFSKSELEEVGNSAIFKAGLEVGRKEALRLVGSVGLILCFDSKSSDKLFDYYESIGYKPSKKSKAYEDRVKSIMLRTGITKFRMSKTEWLGITSISIKIKKPKGSSWVGTDGPVSEGEA